MFFSGDYHVSDIVRDNGYYRDNHKIQYECKQGRVYKGEEHKVVNNIISIIPCINKEWSVPKFKEKQE